MDAIAGVMVFRIFPFEPFEVNLIVYPIPVGWRAKTCRPNFTGRRKLTKRPDQFLAGFRFTCRFLGRRRYFRNRCDLFAESKRVILRFDGAET